MVRDELTRQARRIRHGIRAQIAGDLTLLGAKQRELVEVLGVTTRSSVSKLVREYMNRRELRRSYLEPELAHKLLEIRDPGERALRRRWWIAQGRVVDSTLAEEYAQIKHACAAAEVEE
jgi:hypothetical protein